MITNLEIPDDETALAFGQTFDVPGVLEAMVAFLKPLIAEIVSAAPHVAPTVRFAGDGDRRAPLDEDGYARLRRETLAYARRWNVLGFVARVDVGTFQLRLYPLGRDDLQRIGAREPTLISEEDWRDLDPTPIVEFRPVTGFPLFEGKARSLVELLTRRHAPPGTKLDFERIPALRFPHRAFGTGLGTLRISLLTIPVEP